MKKTNLQIINFLNFARGYLRTNEEKTKFRYALERMEKKASKLFDDYSEAMTKVQIDHAATDADKVILTDAAGNLRFTKEGLFARNKAQKELLAQEVEVEPYFATELPKEPLSEAEQEVCAGFVLPEQEAGDSSAMEGDGVTQPEEVTV